MSLAVSINHTLVPVASVTQTPTVAAVLNFAEKMATSIPPNSRIERPVFWIQTGFERLMRVVYRIAIWFFNHGAMKKAKEEMHGATPEKICELAKPYAPFFPDFALLAFMYGDKNDAKIKEFGSLWLPYGYLLTSDLSSTRVQREAEKRNLLTPFADLITFESTSASEEARIGKALDLLQVASSSLREDNLDFIAHVISETFYTIFPEGIPDQETDLWDSLEDLIGDAEIIGKKRVEYLKDHLLIFVKSFLKKSEVAQNPPMHAIRAHIRHANQSNSVKHLNHLSQPRWASFIKDEELRIIQKCLQYDGEKDPSSLLGAIFNKFEEAKINLQDMAQCFLFPSPYQEHSSAKLIVDYFDEGYPTGKEGLYTAIFLIEDDQTRYVSHLLRERGKVTLIPGFKSPKDNERRVYHLLEEDLVHLEKEGFREVSLMLEEQSFGLIQSGFKNWTFSIENLRRLAELYQDKLDTVELPIVSAERKDRLIIEVEAIRVELVKRMEEAWRTIFPKDMKFSLAEYSEANLLKALEEVIIALEKS